MKNKKIKILLILALVSLPVMLVTRTFQNDTFYTIKVGESIIRNGLDMKDHFSFISDLAYSYPHFLYDVFIYLVYDMFGFNGIYVSTIILSFILFYAIYYVLCECTKNKYLSLVLTIISAISLISYLTARAQLVSYILLLLILYFIEKLRNEENKKYLIPIFVLGVLLANTHAAVYPVIFICFLPYIFNDILYKFKIKIPDKFIIDKEKLSITIKGLLTSILGGFITFNSNPFTYIIKTKMDVTLSYISEHIPPNIKEKPILYIFAFALIIIMIIRKDKIKVKDFLFIFGFMFMAFLSSRSFALFVVLASISIGTYLNSILKEEKIDLEKIINNRFVYTILITFFIIGGINMFYLQSKKPFVDNKKYPVEASNYIKNNLDLSTLRLYNEYNYGSYLLFNNIKVFVDSRSDLYTRGFNKDCTVFKDAMDATVEYIRIFRKYDINHAIVTSDSYLRLLLIMDENYKEIYVDDYFTIFEKVIK